MEDESETGCEICVWSGGFKFPFGGSLLVGARALVLGVRCANCSWIPQHYPVFTFRCVFILFLCILLSWSLDCFHKVVSIWFSGYIMSKHKLPENHLIGNYLNQTLHRLDLLHFRWLLQWTSVRDLLSRTTWSLYIYKVKEWAIELWNFRKI